MMRVQPATAASWSRACAHAATSRGVALALAGCCGAPSAGLRATRPLLATAGLAGWATTGAGVSSRLKRGRVSGGGAAVAALVFLEAERLAGAADCVCASEALPAQRKAKAEHNRTRRRMLAPMRWNDD